MDSSIVKDAYDAHHTALHNYLVSLTRNRDNADDAVQEAYLRLSREVNEGRAPDQPRAWLYQVGRNVIISRARRVAVADRLQHHFVERGLSSAADHVAEAREQTRELDAALREQSAVDRRVLVMAAEGYGAAEIAAAMGSTPGATRTRLSRARTRLRARLQMSPEC
jgi:RNA polymerase sigma-70 factor, ECF subfamily